MVGTPGGYVEGFGEKSFSFLVEISQLSLVKPSDVTSRAFTRNIGTALPRPPMLSRDEVSHFAINVDNMLVNLHFILCL